MKIPYRNLAVRDPGLRRRLLDAVERVLRHGRFLHGPEHDAFELEMARRCGRRHAIGVGSGTDALFLALRALGAGPGDEIVTTSLSWIATANAIAMTGARPVFVDIGWDFNIDAGRIEAAITPATRAILPVHFTGQLCDMQAIQDIADRRGLAVIEDAAQAFGARAFDRPAGSFGRMSCFSMNPMKVFNGFGEAGLIATDDDALAEKLKLLRYGGTVDRQDCRIPSLNCRLDTLQAAMLLVNLETLESRIDARRAISRRYAERLGDVVRCPAEKPGHVHVFNAYSVLAAERDALQAFLAENGIETQVQHRIPMPFHSAYRDTPAGRASIPVCEQVVAGILALPNQEDLGEAGQDYVCAKVREFYD